jgi:hypothetical protein
MPDAADQLVAEALAYSDAPWRRKRSSARRI